MLRQFLVGGGVSICNIAAAAQSLTSTAPDWSPGKIDKSQLALAESKRLRDKAHLKFVASQPCLICGRQPSDPHHLRFAQSFSSAWPTESFFSHGRILYIREMDAVRPLYCAIRISAVSLLGIGFFIWPFSGA